jgi:hypothetical protein
VDDFNEILEDSFPLRVMNICDRITTHLPPYTHTHTHTHTEREREREREREIRE